MSRTGRGASTTKAAATTEPPRPHSSAMAKSPSPHRTRGRVDGPGSTIWANPADKKPGTEAAIQTVAKACVAKKRACAMVTANEAETKKYLGDGFRIIYGTYLAGSSS